MLSYRHAFHAGNFADVLKHFTLIQLIEYLKTKEKAFCCIDTHAGAGSYPLNSHYALTNREFDNGIAKLWDCLDLPAPLEHYVNSIKQFNDSKLCNYPGSPLLVQQLLRPQDRLFLYELHSTDVKALKLAIGKDRRVKVVHGDGLKDSLGLLPPFENRGLILIDPSYELKTDYIDVVNSLLAMYKRFATGTYALWYPVIDRTRIKKMERTLQTSGIKNIQLFELAIEADNSELGMTACGMIVINPPWTLKAQMQQVLPYLSRVLGTQDGRSFRVETLVGE